MDQDNPDSEVEGVQEMRAIVAAREVIEQAKGAIGCDADLELRDLVATIGAALPEIGSGTHRLACGSRWRRCCSDSRPRNPYRRRGRGGFRRRGARTVESPRLPRFPRRGGRRGLGRAGW